MVYPLRVKIMRAFLQISATAVVGVVIYNIRKTKVCRLEVRLSFAFSNLITYFALP